MCYSRCRSRRERANFGNFGTAPAIFDLPYIFNSIEDTGRNSWEGRAKKQTDIAAEEAGHVCPGGCSGGGLRQLANAHGPVHVPLDMEDLKWRATKSPIE